MDAIIFGIESSRLPLLLPNRLARGMQPNHQTAGEEERDVRPELSADRARLLGRVLQGEAGTFIPATPLGASLGKSPEAIRARIFGRKAVRSSLFVLAIAERSKNVDVAHDAENLVRVPADHWGVPSPSSPGVHPKN